MNSRTSIVVACTAALCAVAGCFSPDLGDGAVVCALDRSCPPQYHCADDGRCRRGAASTGGKDLGAADLSVDDITDLAGVTGDLARADLAHPIPVDLSMRDFASHAPDLSGTDCSHICSTGCVPCCVQSCNDTNCSCTTGCSCAFTCTNNTTCAVACGNGAFCAGSAGNNSHAVINCNDSTCEFTCRNNSNCQMNCGGNNGSCLLHCDNNATCDLIGCAGAPTERCSDGSTLVCHHACPPAAR
jgi:hypothetical protein